jgi:YD repeat-containing protein
VQRDSAGRIIIETGEREFRVLRDSRGLPVRLVVSGAGEWRWQRDGSGRVLTAKGPGGADIGVDRDSAGRIKLVRYPNGTLLRRTHDRSTMTDKLTGPGGQLLVSGSTVFGLDGLVESTEVSGEAGWAVKRDKAGALVGMEATDGTSWTWTAEATEDPEGQVHINDVDGRLMEAQLPLGPKAWGIATEMMSVHRDLAGRMVQLGGDGGLSELESDALGRLVGIRPPDASGWKMRFDARGRPVGWTGPIGSSEQWVWAPEADPRDGREGLLVSGAGGETVWNSVAGGDGVRQTDGTIEGLMAGSDEEVAWVISTDGAPVRVRHTPTGFPEVDVAGIAAGGGGVQWFPGGPTQWGSVAIDPVSGERVDGMQRWPWAVHGAVDVDIADRWDTSVWSPEGPWSNPMQMLTEMGELPKIEAGRWMRLGADPVGFYGVAESLDGVVQPLGPAMDAVPLDVEDPITMALLRSVLPGGDAPDALTPAAALIGAEIDLPWMPPGWVIPGLERWTLLGAWRDDDELQ